MNISNPYFTCKIIPQLREYAIELDFMEHCRLSFIQMNKVIPGNAILETGTFRILWDAPFSSNIFPLIWRRCKWAVSSYPSLLHTLSPHSNYNRIRMLRKQLIECVSIYFIYQSLRRFTLHLYVPINFPFALSHVFFHSINQQCSTKAHMNGSFCPYM